MVRRNLFASFAFASLIFCASLAMAEDKPTKSLADGLRPFLKAFSGQQEQFELTGSVELKIEGQPQTVTVRLARFDAESFDLELTHSDYALNIRRRADATALALPKHQVVYLGSGHVAAADCLALNGLTARLVSSGSTVSAYAPLLQSDPKTVALALTKLLDVKFDAKSNSWRAGKDLSFQFSEDASTIDVKAEGTAVKLELADKISTPKAAGDWPDLKVVDIDRLELERQLVRGVRRAAEILAPSAELTNPEQTVRKVPNGELRWIDGQRVALLQGTPEEIGKAHGELLKTEAGRCIDSVLYTFGTVETIRTGRWFPNDLEQAYQRLAPHIPEDHKIETRAMAASLGMEPRLVETLNVFPELFHCSGFAVFGKATTDGKLYHGRVLDYMTAIGLQDACTTFIVAVDGKIPFANVGYAGFIGSVSGMNAQAISLGEMGGRGEGQWDGVPMATLMRRALEDCSTLDEVIELWKTSPRTCAYYYVFADGKSNRAVGVAAVPESIEFVLPGEGHELLGEGIADAVVMSAGSRLEKLRERVNERYGKIDAEAGQWLMSRPVAMQSNLHNVLFVPADGVLYVANADHKRPAAECNYVRLDLNELLQSMKIVTRTASTNK